MKLHFWGTRGNLPTPLPEMLGLGGNTSCYEVQLGERASILLDCGTGLIEHANSVMSSAVREPREFHIVVSHFHWDHLLGFPFFHPIHIPHTTVHLYSAFPQEVLERRIRTLFDGTYSPLRDLANLKARLHFHQIGSDGVEIWGAKVECQPAHHSELCFATRVRYLGRTLCYVSDHEACSGSANDGIVEFMQAADAVLHDAQYTADEYRARVGWGHSSIEAALDNAQRAKVGHLFLTHHDPLHSDAFLHDYVAKLELPNGLRVSLAAEGRVD
jgi:phosphoribosyl 1,2-cyclic phosphodiesterase